MGVSRSPVLGRSHSSRTRASIVHWLYDLAVHSSSSALYSLGSIVHPAFVARVSPSWVSRFLYSLQGCDSAVHVAASCLPMTWNDTAGTFAPALAEEQTAVTDPLDYILLCRCGKVHSFPVPVQLGGGF